MNDLIVSTNNLDIDPPNENLIDDKINKQNYKVEDFIDHDYDDEEEFKI